jgi:signal transduction histidine kinase/CheY-like chemotaxis protein
MTTSTTPDAATDELLVHGGRDALLYVLLDRLSRAATIDEVFAIAMDVLCDALGVTRCSILLFDDDGVMRFRAWRGLSDRYRAAVEGHSPWPFGARDVTPIQVRDIHDDDELSTYAAVFDAESVRALAFIPLRHDRDLIGKFMVYDFEARTFEESEIRLAETIGWQVANAVVRLRVEAARDAALAAAEEANRTKDEFLAVISHELRTPLSSISGWASLLLEHADDPLVTKGLDVIARNAAAQGRIIDDILDASRLATGKLVLARAPVDVCAIVENVVDAVRLSARNKNVELVSSWADGPSRAPLMAMGDAERLTQVFSNILANALKFTRVGGAITVEVVRKGSFVNVSVTDDGAGISPEFLPLVFERFRQADSSRTREHGGLGLGLAIVQHLVHFHGGTVRADSDGLGKGSTFTVSLPSLVVASVDGDGADEAAPGSEVDLHGVRVLMIDDDDDGRELFGLGLERLGATVTVTGSAAAGLEQVAASKPDVIVSDLGMPGEDGYRFLSRLHGMPGARDIPVIAFSAYTSPDDVDLARRAGFVAHVAKPARFDVLARAISSASRLGRPGAARSSTAAR